MQLVYPVEFVINSDLGSAATGPRPSFSRSRLGGKHGTERSRPPPLIVFVPSSMQRAVSVGMQRNNGLTGRVVRAIGLQDNRRGGLAGGDRQGIRGAGNQVDDNDAGHGDRVRDRSNRIVTGASHEHGHGNGENAHPQSMQRGRIRNSATHLRSPTGPGTLFARQRAGTSSVMPDALRNKDRAGSAFLAWPPPPRPHDPWKSCKLLRLLPLGIHATVSTKGLFVSSCDEEVEATASVCVTS